LFPEPHDLRQLYVIEQLMLSGNVKFGRARNKT